MGEHMQASERSPHDFDAAYLGSPPWDTGRPQTAFQELADEGELRGRVLDVGCGTGEHALLAAARGLEATGVDSSTRAIHLPGQGKGRRTWTAGPLRGVGCAAARRTG
jgi:2-polyprenyl-3-methyl-5-hydroxy-6-metoxy-1,4-benzoquinol methylase